MSTPLPFVLGSQRLEPPPGRNGSKDASQMTGIPFDPAGQRVGRARACGYVRSLIGNESKYRRRT